jgi:hypothetical protein
VQKKESNIKHPAYNGAPNKIEYMPTILKVAVLYNKPPALKNNG